MIKQVLYNVRRLGLVLLLFAISFSCAACASSHAVTTSKPQTAATSQKTSSAVSQKRDPSRIYGDKNLDAAYEKWAQNGYPVPPESSDYELDGKASWYGPGLNGNHTASGEVFDMYGMTAAHKKLPFGTIVIVTNQNNNKSVVVRINDRGPFVKGRIIDLSYGAAYLIDMIDAGVVPVTVDIIELGQKKSSKKK